MGDNIYFVDTVLLTDLENLLFSRLRVMLNCGKSVDLASINVKSFDSENALNLAKRLHENAVSDSETVYEDDRVTGVHRV